MNSTYSPVGCASVRQPMHSGQLQGATDPGAHDRDVPAADPLLIEFSRWVSIA